MSTTTIQDEQAIARTELLINIGYLKAQRPILSDASVLHLSRMLIDAMEDYLEAEEDLARQTQNGRPSDHALVAATAVRVSGDFVEEVTLQEVP
jgi:hypothetical protein